MASIKVPAPADGVGPPEPIFEHLLAGGYDEPTARKLSDVVSRAQQATGADVFSGHLAQRRSPDQSLSNYFAGTGIPASKHLAGGAVDVYAEGPNSPKNAEFHRQMAASARDQGVKTGADFTKKDPAHIEVPGNSREARRVIRDYYDLHGLTREDIKKIRDDVKALHPGKDNREKRREVGMERLRTLMQEKEGEQQSRANPTPPTAMRVLDEAYGRQQQHGQVMGAAKQATNIIHEEAISMGARHAAQERHPSHPSASAGPEDFDPVQGTAFAMLQALTKQGKVA